MDTNTQYQYNFGFFSKLTLNLTLKLITLSFISFITTYLILIILNYDEHYVVFSKLMSLSNKKQTVKMLDKYFILNLLLYIHEKP